MMSTGALQGLTVNLWPVLTDKRMKSYLSKSKEGLLKLALKKKLA